MEEKNTNRIIEMAWEDYTPFEAIKIQFGVSEQDVIKIMRKELKPSSFKMWRKRVKSNISRKHPEKKLLKFNSEFEYNLDDDITKSVNLLS